MRTFVAALVLLVGVAMMLACDRTAADEGRDAMLQIERAQFYRGAMPEEAGGPAVISATISTRLSANVVDRGCSGDLDASALAVAIGLGSDVGYWIVPATVPQASAPDTPTFSAVIGLTAKALGRQEVVFRAVDAAGHFGPKTVRPLDVVAPKAPQGRLVISLSWNNAADLDLHVVLPTGIEIFKRNPNEYERPPASAGPVPVGAPTDGGVLDRDSNARCVFDGQRAENVYWTETPPKGHYVVRVDTFSLCGVPSAIWRLGARLDGVLVGAAQGVASEADTRFEHNRGGGVLAMELDVP